MLSQNFIEARNELIETINQLNNQRVDTTTSRLIYLRERRRLFEEMVNNNIRLSEERDRNNRNIPQIRKIETQKHYKPCGKDCSICMEEVKEDGIKTECNHHYHKDCINSWFNIGRNTCPNCRANI